MGPRPATPALAAPQRPALMPALALLAALAAAPLSQALRARVNPASEPPSEHVWDSYRMILSDSSYWTLAWANLLRDARAGALPDHLSNLLIRNASNGENVRAEFRFHSADYHRLAIDLKWFITLEERTALHVYDRAEELELARGPQVDQRMCGLHLEYMLYMARAHNRAFDEATELSIFNLMDTFGSTLTGQSVGNNVFPGLYAKCRGTRLNLFRDQLVAATNESQAAHYFAERVESRKRRSLQQSGGSPAGSLLQALRFYLGPFLYQSLPTTEAPVERFADQLETLPMRHCMAGTRWPQWSNSSHYKRNLKVYMGVCLPDTCDSSSLEHHYSLIRELMATQMSRYLDGFYVHNLYCPPDERSPYRQPFNYRSSSLFILLSAVWLALTLAATASAWWWRLQQGRRLSRRASTLSDLDETTTATTTTTDEERALRSETRDARPSKHWHLLQSWDAFENARQFLDMDKPSSTSASVALAPSQRLAALAVKTNAGYQGTATKRVDMRPLEGLKVLSACSVMTAHACVNLFPAVVNPVEGHWLMSRSLLSIVHVVCPATVNVFFVITGMLTTKILLGSPRYRPHLKKPSFWFNFLVNRYLRIVPMYFLVHWFMQSTFRFVGHGPFWDHATSNSSLARICQEESYWRILVPTANLISPAQTCNGVGWYIASDLQFVLVTPLFVLAYLRSAALGHALVGAASFVSVIDHWLYFMRRPGHGRNTLEFSLMTLTRVLDDETEGYVFPQYRIVAYLIGLAFGQVLEAYERGAIKRWPKWLLRYGKLFVYSVTYLCTVATFLATLLLHIPNRQIMKLVATTFESSLHALVAVALGLFVLFITTGQMPLMAHLYSLQLFKPIANAALSTMLVHMPLQYYRIRTLRWLPELTAHYAIQTVCVWIVESFMIACVVHVIVEIPLRNFLLRLLGGGAQARAGADGASPIANKLLSSQTKRSSSSEHRSPPRTQQASLKQKIN